MDEDAWTAPDPRRPQCRFGPDRRLIAATAVLAVLALVATVLTSDAAGRLLFACATLLLAGYVAVDLYFWPRLSADARGVRIRSPFAVVRLGWDEVDAVRADVRERYGIRSTTLEVDAGERLIVFSRRALGADPAEVAELVRAFDPR